MTHLVFLTNFIPPYREAVLIRLNNVVDRMTVLVSVLQESNRLWKPSQPDFAVIQQKNISVGWQPRYRHGTSDFGYLHFPYDTLFQLNRLAPDVILSGELGFRTLQAVIYVKLFSKKTSLIIHADLSEVTESCRNTVLRRVFRKWLLHQANAIIVNGTSGKRYIQSLTSAEKQIFCIPYTTEIDKFLHAKTNFGREPSQPLQLLYVGHLVSLKGLLPFAHSLINWAQAHPATHLNWRLIGHGNLSTTLQNLQTPPNLHIELLGHLPYESLPQSYAQADWFVFPSFADTWGVVVNEAMATGLPVLGSLYSQAVEEMVQDGETGWTFYPDQPETMQRSFSKAFSLSSQQLARMQIHTRLKASQISPEYVADKILQTINAARGLS